MKINLCIIIEVNHMQIDIFKLKENIGESEYYQIDERFEDVTEPSSEIKWLKPVTGQLKLTNTGESILIEGEIYTEALLQCSRCLKKFTFLVDTTFKEKYFEKQDDEEEIVKEQLLNTKDLSTFFYQGDILDLDDLLKNSIYLELPMKPVCNQACKGICPRCGQDLNEGKCECKIEHVDPRWDKLKGFLKE